MADGEGGGQFLERGRRLFFDVGRKFLGIERAPLAPTRFRGKGTGFGGAQIAIDRAPPHVKAAGGRDLGTAFLKKLHDPFPQIQCISFHAAMLVTLCAYVNVNCYTGLEELPQIRAPAKRSGASSARKIAPQCSRRRSPPTSPINSEHPIQGSLASQSPFYLHSNWLPIMTGF